MLLTRHDHESCHMTNPHKREAKLRWDHRALSTRSYGRSAAEKVTEKPFRRCVPFALVKFCRLCAKPQSLQLTFVRSMDPYSSGVDDYIPRRRSPWVLVGE